MSSATRVGDMSTGHDMCAGTSLSTGSSSVLINGKGAGRVGDTYAPHGCLEHSTHSDRISSGSSSVFINGVPAARVGDSVSIGGSVASGSPNVFIGG